MSLLTWILLGIDASVLLLLLFLFIFIRYFLYSFLALNRAIDAADILVVEGWLEEQNLSEAIAEFEAGGYDYLVTVGGPLKLGSALSGHKTLAELCASTLLKLGFDADKLIAVPSPTVAKNQTATTAVMFQSWLSNHNLDIRGINIYSNHVHARRTWLLYQQHLPSNIEVGVIASTPLDYDPTGWWHTSHGVRCVIMEFIGYCHIMLHLWRPWMQA